MKPFEFENIWHDKLSAELLKNFPNDFIGNLNFKEVVLPEKPLIKGTEIFGMHEIIDTD